MNVRETLHIRNVPDEDGVVHRLIFTDRSSGPAMVAARCGKVVVTKKSNPCPTTANVSCMFCLLDPWEPRGRID